MKTVKARDRFNEPVTGAVLQRAIQRGKLRAHKGLHARRVRYLPAFKALLIGFSDESAVVLPVKNYPELMELSAAEIKHLTVGFGGSALCLDTHDMHISIAGLVSASPPLMEMAATVVAARNGSRSSRIKAAAARENGRRGGRPRKHAVG